jgi:hypothetical protein
MNDFPVPEHEKRAESCCAARSESQHGGRSAMSMAVGLMLPLSIWSVSARPVAAETYVDASAVQSAAAEEKDEPDMSDEHGHIVSPPLQSGH